MPTIIFKATEACNSNCIYCDVVTRKKPLTIKDDLLQLSFVRINEYLETKTEDSFEIVWHGGEPLIPGVKFFERVLELQKQFCPNTSKRIKHSIQSNITLVSNDFIPIFKKMNLKIIGTSYDPHNGIRGFGANRDSIAYNKAFMKGINLLEENDIQWGFIYVVTKNDLSNPLELFYTLTNFKHNGGFNFHPVVIFENNDINNISITPTEYAEFLGIIFQEWWINRRNFPLVDPFRSYLEYYTNSKEGSMTCNDSGNCAYSHVYIGPLGEASHCGRSADWGLMDYGNINDLSLIDIFLNKQRLDIEKRKDILFNNECKDCEYWDICHGGCPMDSWNSKKDFSHKTNWCAANKIFLKKYFEPLTNLKPNFVFNEQI